MNENETPAPVIPERVRTAAYIVGIVVGVAGGGIGVALELPGFAGVCAAISAACNALAFGYRPTRATGNDG